MADKAKEEDATPKPTITGACRPLTASKTATTPSDSCSHFPFDLRSPKYRSPPFHDNHAHRLRTHILRIEVDAVGVELLFEKNIWTRS